MKNIMILLLVVLGTTVRTFADQNSDQKTVLSPDKSKVFVISVIQGKKIIKEPQKCTEITTKVSDTVFTFFVTNEAKRYINDSLASLFFRTGKVYLSDSLIPRQTHLFGHETYLKRELEISGNSIYFSFAGQEYRPALLRIWVLIIFSVSIILVLIFWLFFTGEINLSDQIVISIGVFLALISLFFWTRKDINVITNRDCFLIPAMLMSLSFLRLIILLFKPKKKDNKQIQLKTS